LPLIMSAQAVRAILLASATATTLNGISLTIDLRWIGPEQIHYATRAEFPDYKRELAKLFELLRTCQQVGNAGDMPP
jgi:hypothetical protein